MKILHVNLEMHWGGGEKQLIQLIEESSLESVLICIRSSKLHEYCLAKQLPHYCMSSRSPYNIQSISGFIKASKQYKPDIIHLHTSKAHTLGVIAGWFYQSPPLVVTRRMSTPLKDNFFSKYKYNHSGVKKIICVSQAW